jgi:hypothetical protein
MAAASWLLITIGITVATGEWAAFPATGLGLIGFGLVRAGRNEAAPLFLVGVYWQSLSRWVLPPAVVDAVRSNTGLAILSALVVLVGIWALRSVYPAAGDSHLARRAEQLKGAAWWQRDGAANMVEGGRLSQWTVAKVYPRMLQRASRQRRPGMMLMHALGPVAHWSIWIGSLALMFLVCGGVRLLLAWRGREALSHFLDGAMGAGLTAMTMLILFSTAAFSQQIRKTTGEQSLLRLTPLAGDAALLNRRLAVELLKSGLRNWAMLTVAILLATVLLGAGSRIVLFQAALCVLAGQVATFALLGDFAGDGGWNVPRALQAGLLAIAELLLALGLDKLSGMSIWLWLAAISAGTAAWQLRRAWRTMLAAPAAYPAGRTT